MAQSVEVVGRAERPDHLPADECVPFGARDRAVALAGVGMLVAGWEAEAELEALVVPRVLAAVIMMPLLGFYAALISIMGGCLLCWVALGIPAVAVRLSIKRAIASRLPDRVAPWSASQSQRSRWPSSL